MKEVEIKATLRDKEKIMAKLKALGCAFEKAVTQEDTVYAKNVGSLKNFRNNDVFLRIRVKNGKKIIFTIKKRMSNDLDAIEHEVEVSSKEEMHAAILMMGYSEAVRIKKSRVTTTYDGCEICIDEVDGLGSFIEMEKLTKEGDSEKIQEELFTFFETLGIKREDRMMSGYDILIMQR
jgi:adenylate cyclase class 2